MNKSQRQTEPNVLKKFADLLGTKVKKRRVDIPERYGKGYCKGIVFNEHIRMLILNYELTDNFVITNPDTDAPPRMLLFKFQNIFPPPETTATGRPVKAMPSVLIATRTMNADVVIPVHSHTATINIEVDADYLNGLFAFSDKSPVLQSLLANNQPFLFEQIMYPSLQKIVDEIVSDPAGETFESFFLRVKAEELICRLLMELEKRDEKHLYALNNNDIQTVYKVKEQMLEHLGTPPVIKDLAAVANMSPSKLKRLFQQVFGNSIFSYYQEFRMQEAARLLKEGNLTVSEAGYQMGFTNLSHFSRVFNEHIGKKPKRYSKGIN